MNVVENLRNIAIIAHVDHGKTTLVDELLKQSGTFRSNEQVEERVMDSNDLERERGITILSKNTSVFYKGTKINIVDTPGHADFGGEVERVLKMVEGVLLVVDAFEGPMPQTKFVLRKALELHKKPLVVINKIDRPEARPEAVLDMVLDLFIELNAPDDLLEFPFIYASGKAGFAVNELDDEQKDMQPLFDAIIENISGPTVDREKPLQLMVTTLDYNEYVGKIGIGKIERGRIKTNTPVAVCTTEGDIKNAKIGKLYTYSGLSRVETDAAEAGDIVAFSGISDINIGETVADVEHPEALDFVQIDKPTISMTFKVNDSPFAGQEGKFITTRQIRERLTKELETNVSLTVEDTENTDAFKVSGRGELHLSILIETMRREGYELQVSRPQVIYQEIDGVRCEPIEELTIDVPEEFMGAVIENLGQRKADMVNMAPSDTGMMRLVFYVPSRGLIGFRTEFLTDTKGNGIMNHIFHGYEPFKGEIPQRKRGSLIAHEPGEASAYGLFGAQDRGRLIIPAGVKVYEGMIVGENSRADDMVVNVCKQKKLTNMRASGSDDSLRLVPHVNLSLEQALEFIKDDELVEITPESIRLRKVILQASMRGRAKK